MYLTTRAWWRRRVGSCFHQQEPELLVKRILSTRHELGVPLARHFQAFRKPYVEHLVKKISRENALFSLATALPDIIPSFIELPWAIAEFTSDTAFITMNQIRMAFLLAAASDRQVGYLEQKSEIAAVIGSAFGWRALARQVAGKIPFGAGLIPKAAIAYAGTRVLGASIERFYRIGYAYTREERESMYSYNLRTRQEGGKPDPAESATGFGRNSMTKRDPRSAEQLTPKRPRPQARDIRDSRLALAMINGSVPGYVQRSAKAAPA